MNIDIHKIQKLFTRKNLNKINVFAAFLRVNVKHTRTKFTTPSLIAHKSIPDDSTNRALMKNYNLRDSPERTKPDRLVDARSHRATAGFVP